MVYFPSSHSVTNGQLTVTVLPAVYHGGNSVVLSSVIQVFCTASHVSLTTPPNITWMKANPTDPMPLASDPPHIRIRTSSDESTGRTSSVLTIDYFTTEDDGTYHCQASNGADTEMSTLMQFTG